MNDYEVEIIRPDMTVDSYEILANSPKEAMDEALDGNEFFISNLEKCIPNPLIFATFFIKNNPSYTNKLRLPENIDHLKDREDFHYLDNFFNNMKNVHSMIGYFNLNINFLYRNLKVYDEKNKVVLEKNGEKDYDWFFTPKVF